jgi:hypothetical protein
MLYDDEALTDRIYREAVLFLETDGKFPVAIMWDRFCTEICWT